MKYSFLREVRVGAERKITFSLEEERWNHVRVIAHLGDHTLEEHVQNTPHSISIAKKKMARQLVTEILPSSSPKKSL